MLENVGKKFILRIKKLHKRLKIGESETLIVNFSEPYTL